MNREQLQSILDRVREATGPDRELDEALMNAFDPGAIRHSSVNLAYTASIDAALALADRVLPARWEVAMGTCGEEDIPWACVTEPDEPCRDFSASALDIPLAILAATLSALIEAQQ